MSLSGRVAIVTGGATGIGAGIASVLAERGARIAIVQPILAQAEEAARALPDAAGFAADISDADQVERMTRAVIERFGGVDILVNNASLTGLPALASFVTASRDHVHAMLDVNVKGTIWCSQAVVKHMIATGRAGNIVHIASVGAFAAQELASVYCASKAAQVSLADARRGSASATCVAIPLFYKNEQMARRNTLIRIGVPELISPEHNDPADNKQHPLAIVNRKTGYTGVSFYLAHCSKFARPEVLPLRVEGSTSGIRPAASAAARQWVRNTIDQQSEKTRRRSEWIAAKDRSRENCRRFRSRLSNGTGNGPPLN